jgi:hypothetical protein
MEPPSGSCIESTSTRQPYYVLFTLVWRTGLCIDRVRARDLDDYRPDKQCLEIYHRSGTGTGLADGRAAELHVVLTTGTCKLIEHYRG